MIAVGATRATFAFVGTALVVGACSDAPGSADVHTTEAIDPPTTPTPTLHKEWLATSPTLPPPATIPGDVLGRGSAGPALVSPVAHEVGAIVVDAPNTSRLTVDWWPPDWDPCSGVVATAEVGRGGAIFVQMFVDGEPDDTCDDEVAIGQVVIDLDEPLDGRHIYTSLVPEEGDVAAPTERMADAVIGLHLDDATAMAEQAGMTIRNLTDAEAVEDDLRTNRINIIHDDDGIVVFAQVY